MTAYTPYVTDPTAVMGRRIAAYAIDLVLLLILTAAIVGPIANGDKTHFKAPTTTEASDFCDRFNNGDSNGVCVNLQRDVYVWDEDAVRTAFGVFSAVAAGFWVVNWILLQGVAGGSVGKLLTGLRVVRYDGRRAGIGWCALRTLLLIVDTAVCWIPGLVSSLTTKGHRRIGDLAAKTLVVPKGFEGQPVQVPGLTVPESAAYVGAGWQTPGPGGYGTAPTAPPPGAPTGGWTAPQAPSEPPAPTEAPGDGGTGGTTGTPASTPGAEGPHWDEARGAYIQYDHARGAWLQWDDAAKEWKQI